MAFRGASPFTRTCQFELSSEGVRGDIRQGHLGNAIWGFGVRNPNRPILQIEMALLHTGKFFVDTEAGFRDDANNIAQVRRGDRRPECFNFGVQYTLRWSGFFSFVGRCVGQF